VYYLAPASRPTLGPTQPPIQWVPGVLSPGGKARPGRDADHSPPSSAEVKNEWELYVLSPHLPPWRVAGQLYFFFTLLSVLSTFSRMLCSVELVGWLVCIYEGESNENRKTEIKI
jgi:hypothetical protein